MKHLRKYLQPALLAALLVIAPGCKSWGNAWEETKRATVELGPPFVIGLIVLPFSGLAAILATGGSTYLVGLYNDKAELKAAVEDKQQLEERVARLEGAVNASSKGKITFPPITVDEDASADEPSLLERLFDLDWLLGKLKVLAFWVIAFAIGRWAWKRWVAKGGNLGTLASFIFDWLGTAFIKPVGKAGVAGVRALAGRLRKRLPAITGSPTTRSEHPDSGTEKP